MEYKFNADGSLYIPIPEKPKKVKKVKPVIKKEKPIKKQ